MLLKISKESHYINLKYIAETYIAENYDGKSMDAVIVRMIDKTTHVIYKGSPEECGKVIDNFADYLTWLEITPENVIVSAKY